MKKFLFLSLIVFSFWSCNDDSAVEKEIANIKIDCKIERFDRQFANASPNDLKSLKFSYPFLFSKSVPDSIWIMRMQDSLQNQLFNEVAMVFDEPLSLKEDINSLFKHLKYYDKSFTVPRVITLTNDVDYRNKVVVTDTIVLIALDNYLGAVHPYYQNIQRYIAANMQKDQIVVDLAEKYAEKYVFPTKRQSFLDEMIYFGKLLYFKDRIIPFEDDANKIGYSQEELDWAEANESPIWSYFIEKELLYSTDPNLSNRFIANAPFSKFYLELDNESPGRLGQYIGWQIVRAYAEKNDVGLMQLMREEPRVIFENSNFKPMK
ncbi:MAG: gliding motility lipoprotein GldB [Winogradskyella sp.]|nr:gliding motility lipoprotein GldB [Winogradskyella sp.]